MLREERIAHRRVHEADFDQAPEQVVVGHDAMLGIEHDRAARVDEQREGVPSLVGLAVRRVDDAVPGGTHAPAVHGPLVVQTSAQEQLEHVPSVHDDLVGLLVRIEPGTVVGLYLQSARSGGQQEGDQVDVRVLTGAYGSGRSRITHRRVVEHTQQGVAAAGHAGERVRGEFEVLVQAGEQVESQALQRVVERDHDRAEVRDEVVREQVVPGLAQTAHVPEPLEVGLVLWCVAGVFDLERREARRSAVLRRLVTLEHVVGVGEELLGNPTARADEMQWYARVGQLGEAGVDERIAELAYEAVTVGVE